MSRVIGIDPGKGGAIAVLDSCGELVTIDDMPVVGKQVSPQLLSDLVIDAVEYALAGGVDFPSDYVTAVVEQVHSMPKQGVASSFNFGMAYGITLGVLAGTRSCRIEHVTPSKWKRAMGVTADKETARLKALDRWPSWSGSFKLKKHADRAEAALIALWWIESQG